MDVMTAIDQLEARFAEREPSVQAFVPEEGRFERLRNEAQGQLSRYPDPATRPPLFGVLTGIKDTFHVDGFVTQAGTRLPPGVLQAPEAESVTMLKQAGVLIVGKARATEFGYFAPGPTRNPHNLDHTPGGSSSGSAAGVAAGLCDLALGSQTIGSITRPAAYCGVVAYKPSYDRIPRAGEIPLAPSVDYVGVFSPRIAGTRQAASELCADWDPSAAPDRQPVLGIPEGPYLARATAEGLTHFRAACRRLADAGFEIKSVEAMPDFDAIFERHNKLVAREAAEVLSEWFDEFGAYYHPDTVKRIERGQQVTDEELAQALKGRYQLRDEITTLMDEHGIDLWLTPATTGPAPKGLADTGDPVMNLPWSHCGLPTINLPTSKNGAGLPLGLQVVGRWYGDEMLLEWGSTLETHLDYRFEAH
jgi:Asp-tRNA(Asn)/Glu-tRNA(Gln) amidotransferase A subunit family amidase